MYYVHVHTYHDIKSDENWSVGLPQFCYCDLWPEKQEEQKDNVGDEEHQVPYSYSVREKQKKNWIKIQMLAKFLSILQVWLLI